LFWILPAFSFLFRFYGIRRFFEGTRIGFLLKLTKRTAVNLCNYHDIWKFIFIFAQFGFFGFLFIIFNWILWNFRPSKYKNTLIKSKTWRLPYILFNYCWALEDGHWTVRVPFPIHFWFFNPLIVCVLKTLYVDPSPESEK